MTRARSKLALATILTLASMLAGSESSAERLPDWARDIAKGAPATPEGLAPYPERILMSEVRYAVQENGSLRVRRRLAVQELGTDPNGVSVGFFHLNPTARIEDSRCWLLPPRGRASIKEISPVDVTISDSFLTDTKVSAIGIAGVVKGSIVFFEFEALDSPYFVSLIHLFYESAPAQVVRFELEIPAGWRAEPVWIRGSGPGPATAGRVMTWELRGLSVPLSEPLGPDPPDEAPLLGVHLVPPADARLKPKIFADWAAMSVWYDDLARDRREVSTEIRMEAGRLDGDEDSGIFPILLAAARYVRDSIRYVDIELGIGGYKPHAASETLSNLYGDCKDKATLLGALLAARDIPSYPVLVNLTSRDTVDERFPVGAFNHLVLAVPLKQELSVPLSFTHAVADAGELGRVLIIDVTDERTAIGSLSSDLAGKRALLVAGTRGRLINLPLDDASWHTITRRILSRSDGARRIMERTSTYSGEFAAAARHSYGSSALERQRGLERRMLEIWPGAAFLGSESERETIAGDYVETLRLGCASLSCSPAADRFELFPGAGDEVDRVPLGRRTTAVQYAHRFKIRYLSRYEGLSLAEAPTARRLEGAGWFVETSHTLRDGVLESVWEVRLERTRFEPDAFAELKRFWAAVSSTAATTITFGGQAR